MTTYASIEKFDVSLAFDTGVTLPSETELILAFHTFIQTQRLNDTLIDVSNYLHVTTGPGILLIGHKAFRAVRLEQGCAGVTLSGRRLIAKDKRTFLQEHVVALLEFARALESYFERNLFSTESLTIRLNDRRYSLDNNSAQGLLAAVDEDLRGLDLDVAKLGLRESDYREQVAVDVQLRASSSLAELQARLNPKDQAA